MADQVKLAEPLSHFLNFTAPQPLSETNLARIGGKDLFSLTIGLDDLDADFKQGFGTTHPRPASRAQPPGQIFLGLSKWVFRGFNKGFRWLRNPFYF